MSKPHKHVEVIKVWADGKEIEWSWEGRDWMPVKNNCPSWEEMLHYRVKPEPPAKVYPGTEMSDEDLHCAFNGNRFQGLTPAPFDWGARFLANEAIKRAIDSKQVVTMADHHDAIQALGQAMKGVEIARHAARDLAIAEAVRAWYERQWPMIAISDAFPNLDAIVAGVK